MGLLNADEAREVEQNRKQYPEIDEEIRKIEAGLEGYARMHATSPPESLKEQIWEQLEKETQTYVNAPREAVIRQMPVERGSMFLYLAAASIILLVGSVIGNFYLYGRWKNTENELTAATNEKSVLAQDLKTSKASYQLASDELSIVRNPTNKVVKMTGLPVAPQATAIVYWDSTAGRTYIDPATLPVPPAGKQYQLWAIADGKPVDAGVFDVNEQEKGIQPVKAVKNAQLFAVTLEPTGGVSQPNASSVMYVAGKLL